MNLRNYKVMAAALLLEAFCMFEQVVAQHNDIRNRPVAVYLNYFAESPNKKTSNNQSRLWLYRAARALRGGLGIQSEDDVGALLRMSREQAVDQLSRHPRFEDTVAAYLLFFKGVSLPIRDKYDLLNPRLVEFPDVEIGRASCRERVYVLV